MNPDNISTLPILNDLIREGLVHLDIIDPGVILICLALRVVRNLIVEYGPEDLLAIMRVVPIKIAILSEDCQGIVFGCQSILNVLLLLRILESIGRHPQCPHPDLVVQLLIPDGSQHSISKSAIALISRDNCPVSMSKHPVMGITSAKLGLTNTCPAKRCCLLQSLIVHQYICGRRRARP